jgi:clan AA aspartic protease
VPAIEVEIGSQRWQAIIDTGFNGELELPEQLRSNLNAQFVGRATSLLAANQQIEEDLYLVDFPFDGRMVRAQATFVDGDEILLGTRLLRDYRLQIDFPARSVFLEKSR